MVLILLNLLLKFVEGDLLVLNDQVDLELLDTETDRDQLVTTPNKTIHFDSLNILHQLVHVRLIIPRLHVKGNNRFGSWLGTLGLLLGLVVCKSLLAFSDDLWVFLLLVAAEQVLLLFFLSIWSILGVDGYSDWLWAVCGVLFGWVTWQAGEL